MSRKHEKNGSKDDEVQTGGWQVIYTGFVLILLCFFIMLCSFASMEKTKVLQFVRSFSHAVSILSGGLSFEPGKTVLNLSPDIVDRESEIARLFSDVVDYTKKYQLDKNINLSFTEKGLVMTLSDKMLFDIGVARISPEALPLLEKIGEIISKTTYPVRVEGHTDNLPILTDRFPSNWELSTARAVSVLRYFIEEDNIPSTRLSAAGFGEFQPVFPNDTAEHRKKNRRVEIIFLKNK